MASGDPFLQAANIAAGGTAVVQPGVGVSYCITFIGGIVASGTTAGKIQATTDGTNWFDGGWLASATNIGYDTYGLAFAGGRLWLTNTKYIRIAAPAGAAMNYVVSGFEL